MAESGRHHRQLAQYLNKHKSQGKQNGNEGQGKTIASQNSLTLHHNDVRGNQQNQHKPSSLRDKNTSSSRSRSMEKTFSHNSRRPKIHGKATIDHLPDEILLKIFRYLEAHSLLRAASVCHHWQGIANDNFLWEEIFRHYASKLPGIKVTKIPEKPPLSYWKQLCIKRCSEQRNKSAFHMLRAIYPYTGLPRHTEKALKKAGVYFQLSLLDRDGVEHLSMTKDVFYHTMTVTVRWHSLTNVAPLTRIKKIQVLACNPLFFETNGSAVPNSPYQRSLLLEDDISWRSWIEKNPALVSDDLVSLHRLPSGLVIATWKDGGELAFVTVGFHFNHLVHRCLWGKANNIYEMPPHKVISDDIDPCYGLHHFSVTVELRNMRQPLWNQQFKTVDCKREGIRGDYASFILIRKHFTIDHVIITKNLNLPWKTELFKGILKNVAWLDIVMLDERNEVFWAVSSLIKADLQKQSKTFDFDYNGEQNLEVHLSEDKGQVFMELNQMDDGRLFVTSLELKVKFSAIDEWFGSCYSEQTSLTK
ncbi:F-box only protein 15-like [Gigantopelta aegis]|uniref:F-box only protein 15-like n=1 Tax=Gigantopelta aegis TaxID=1735272 RepID=UPI001B88C5C3|nr:F-box only protein 15-like [Gigantopelta aegis]